MTEQELQILIAAYQLLRGAKLDNITVEQAHTAGATLVNFKAVIDVKMAEYQQQEGEGNETED